MPPGVAVCALCGQPLQQGLPFARMVRGWSLPREAGGQNAVFRREVVPDQVAHVSCVKSPGIGQGKLV